MDCSICTSSASLPTGQKAGYSRLLHSHDALPTPTKFNIAGRLSKQTTLSDGEITVLLLVKFEFVRHCHEASRRCGLVAPLRKATTTGRANAGTIPNRSQTATETYTGISQKLISKKAQSPCSENAPDRPAHIATPGE